MLKINAPQQASLPSSPSHHRRHRIIASNDPPPPSFAASSKNPSILSLCRKGQVKEAIRQLKHEPNPTQHMFELLIQSCVRKNAIDDAFSVHEGLSENGFHQDPFLATKLIGMYSELNSIEHARNAFDKIRHKTIYVWNAIFRALSRSGHGMEVLSLYRKMNKIGIPNDKFTYTYALKACVVSESELSYLKHVKEIHAHILRHGYEPNVHIMTTLFDTYAKFGFVEVAHNVFLSMAVKNLVSWTAMIACFAKNGKPFEALNLFREMMLVSANGGGGVLPNPVTMVSVLQACASVCALEQGMLIHAYVIRRGLNSNLPVMNTLIMMYARCGELELGKNVFDLMEKIDVVSWNSLISGYGIQGLGKAALSIFNDMVGSGVSPNSVTFISLLGACSHAGLVDEGKKLFISMVKEYGIQPGEEHYACMVDLLGRANHLDEAAQFIVDMREEPGRKIWGALLGACRIHCNFMLAERACEKLFEMEPENAGNYVLLADIYAEAKMWEDVKRVKKLLEARGLEKALGSSWIEVGKRVYLISSVDELNPQIEEMVVELSREMTETKAILCEEKQRLVVLGHSEKLAVAFGLINCGNGRTIRITKNLRLCQDCHSFTKFVSRFAGREILVRDVNRLHRFRDGECSCRDYW